MTSRHTHFVLIAAVAVAAAGVSLGADNFVSPEKLLNDAKQARQKAEKDLAAARKFILHERKALAAELQKAYGDLASAKEESKKAAHSLKQLQADNEAARRGAALISRKIQNMVVQATKTSGAKIDPAGAIPGMEKAIWNGLEKRLSKIETDTKITVSNEKAVDRSGNEITLSVLRLGAFASYACGDERETCGLLRTLEDGRMIIAGPYLDSDQLSGLRNMAGGKASVLPLDLDGSLINRAPVEGAGFADWLESGGMFIIPIIIVGILGILLILERVVYLVRTTAPPSTVRQTLTHLENGDLQAARQLLSAANTPTSRVLLAGLDAMGKSEEQRDAAMESALLTEAPRLERSLSLLAAMAGVAPLLGLLGTVSGMILTFNTISSTGTSNPRLLSGGISEAMITTQLGLMVAIPLLLAHAWLRRWVQRRESLLEYNAIQIFGLNGHDKHEEGADK